MNRLIDSPVWKIFAGKNYTNCRYLFLIFIPHVLSAVLEGGSFALILLAFSSIEGAQSQPIAIPSFLHLDSLLQSLTKLEKFYFFLSCAIGFQAFRGFAGYLALYGTSLLSLKIQTDAQKKVYQQIFKFSFPFVSQYKIGDLNEYVKGPSIFIPPLFESSNRFLVSLFMIGGLTYVLFSISKILTLLNLILFALFAFAQKSLIKKVSHFAQQLTNQLFELSHQTVQSLQGLRPIYIFHKHNFILNKIYGLLDRIAKSSKRVYLWNNAIPTINETVSVLLVGAVLLLGSIFLMGGDHTALPSLLTYVILTYRLATRLQIGMTSLGTATLYYGSILRLNEILTDHGKEFSLPGVVECKGWDQKIEFKGVSLRYPNAANLTLEDLSFTIQKGTTVAFVGLSGAGKSSVLDLILRLRDPSQGVIFIDNLPLNSLIEESWRKKIGVVSQDTFVFNESIEENIRFGDLEATEEEVREAAALAGAAHFIQHLPDGYKTIIGERGYKVSGGERQRIALARAALRKPEILILDEATSSLDSISEEIIQKSLDRMQNTKTLIVVAHRLSTVANADQIFVLEQGRIVEQGRHQELLSQNGRYAELWSFQSR